MTCLPRQLINSLVKPLIKPLLHQPLRHCLAGFGLWAIAPLLAHPAQAQGFPFSFPFAPPFSVSGASASSDSSAFVLDFEGLDDFEAVGAFYAGGEGGNGNFSGFDFGVTFSDNALALLDADAGGQSGNFGGEATPDTILFFRGPSASDPNQRDAAIMNVAGGFRNGFSVFYSAITAPGRVNIYEDLDAQGTLLASFDLPLTPRSGAPDPTGEFSPFLPAGGTFEGIARSVSFEGAARRIGFDNVTLGSAEPLPGFTAEYPYLKPEEPIKKVPEASPAIALLVLAGGSWAGLHRRRT